MNKQSKYFAELFQFIEGKNRIENKILNCSIFLTFLFDY